MKRIWAAMAVLVVLGVAGVAGGYAVWQQKLSAPLTIEEPVLYQVPSGAGFSRVVGELEAQGVISDGWAFRLLIKLSPEELPDLRSGEYQLSPDMNGRELMALLDSNDVVTYPLTFPEGGPSLRCASCWPPRRSLSSARRT